MWSRFAFFPLLLALMPALTHAQDTGADKQSRVVADRVGEILVIGDRRREAEAVRDLTALVTRQDARHKPLPRFYQPFCPRVLGTPADYAAELAERISANARGAGAVVADEECQPNALLILTRDARKALKVLRREQPWFFTNMPEAAVKRLFESNEQAFAWQVPEIRGADGKPVRKVEVEIGMPPVKRELIINDQWHTSRLSQTIRVDVSGAIVLIDSRYLPGKTLAQLADYASMRLLASTNAVSAEDAASLPTILSLFTAPEDAPSGLTPFDIGYLRALYSLRPNANALAIKDAAVKAYIEETEK